MNNEVDMWDFRYREKPMVLFDMDGTLTEPRKELHPSIIDPLILLSEFTEIGILTGSDIDYIRQQMKPLLSDDRIRHRIHLLPCNGTKHYIPPTVMTEDYKLIYQIDMKNRLGKQSFNELMAIILHQQVNFSDTGISLSGHFIDYRGSMVNWCPIGRLADHAEREIFVSFDNSINPSYRERFLGRLKEKLSLNGLAGEITCALGGDTSFDIYPIGWDKTYSLKHFSNCDVWFVGDRCDENGNDRAIYEILKNKNRSFKTTGPKITADIIMKNIIPNLKKDESVS